MCPRNIFYASYAQGTYCYCLACKARPFFLPHIFLDFVEDV